MQEWIIEFIDKAENDGILPSDLRNQKQLFVSSEYANKDDIEIKFESELSATNKFREIDFTAKFKDSGEVFDSNIASELKKLSPHAIAKSFTFSLGQEMFLQGISDFLIGKDIDKFPKEFKYSELGKIKSEINTIKSSPTSMKLQRNIFSQQRSLPSKMGSIKFSK